MTFEELEKKVGFAMAVALQHEELQKRPDFLDKLDASQLTSILWCQEIPDDMKQRARERILEKATTFQDLACIVTNCRCYPDLVEAARKRICDSAKTVDQYMYGLNEAAPDFAVLRRLAQTAVEWSRVAGVALFRNHEEDVNNAVLKFGEKARSLGIDDLVKIVGHKPIDEINSLCLNLIREAEVTFDKLIEMAKCQISQVVDDILFEKALSKVNSISDCRKLQKSLYFPTSGTRCFPFLKKAAEFAQAFEDWLWLAHINRADKPFAQLLAQGLADTAVTIDQWKITYQSSLPDWPMHALAFRKMKELAGA